MAVHPFILRAPAAIVLGLAGMLLISCQAPDLMSAKKLPPQQAMSKPVDLKRFMGDWYVIAHIPTFIEKEAYNAVERYDLNADGSIATTFTFNKGTFGGPLKTYRPTGFVHNRETNAEWRMQFLWPLKSAYLITRLDDDYQTTIVGVPSRKYVWIMARKKTIPQADYEKLVAEVKRSGHDVSKLREVPQR